ncbi:MFS transporter [Hydrocarboniphaga effusa]|uniref:MFS transporter n=1 Tax=Hydrocarboniphaga effusa TaxID=243629 RepID=UPI003BAC341A
MEYSGEILDPRRHNPPDTNPHTIQADIAMRNRVRRAGAIGNFIEYFDNALYGFFAVTISTLFFPKSDPVAALLATFAIFGVSFVARPIGAMFFGYVGDRWGRKTVLVAAVLMMSAATTIIGLLPTYEAVGVLSPLLLLLCRLLQGFSAGGESTTAFVFVTEHSPVSERGRNNAPLVSATIASSVAAAAVAMLATSLTTPEQLNAWAWRLPFFLAIPLGIVGLMLRSQIDESETYKAASKVSNIINKFDKQKHRSPLGQAFSTSKAEMLVLFLWVAMVSVTGYLVVGYMVTHLERFEGYAKSTALSIMVTSLAIAAIAVFAFGRLADRVSRKQFAMIISLGLIVWTIPAFVLLSHGPVAAIIALSIFASLQYSAMFTAALATVELFPVDVRASASALPYAASFAVFGGSAPYIATWLAAHYSAVAPAYYVMFFAVGGLLVAWLGLPNARSMDVLADSKTKLH